ncbi:AI-2E family transporter [Halovivax limisalsi]|uniref:AI-2E family transporter n=1 Tax=Halovivax limisalsi TaxID=1453760 RepID=UPI001FFDC0B8|nr:AI-2E family transporter [Halovivax limisalsi]
MDVRTKFFAGLVVALAVIGYLMVAPFLQYVLGAALLAFVLHPFHRRLAPRVGGRVSAALLTVAAFAVAVVPLVVFSFLLVSWAAEFVDRLGTGDLEVMIESSRTFLVDEVGIPAVYVDDLESTILTTIEDVGLSTSEFVLSELVNVINTTLHTTVGLMTLAFLLYYFLLDGRTLIAWMRQVVPLHDDVQRELEDEISTVAWAVINSHLLIAVVQGTLGGIGLYLVGVSNVTFWTVVMIVMGVIPVMGVWVVWTPAVGYLWFTGETGSALVLLAYGVAVLSVVDNYLRAIVVDRGSGLHPGVVLVGVLGGIYLLGFLGIFLGPVILAVLKASMVVFSENWRVTDDPEPEAPSTPESIAQD